MVRYLSLEEILAIHERVLQETGGLKGIRDVGLLFSIAEKPKLKIAGEEMYSDVFMKAAAYMEALVNYHVFSDGNKRTAFLTAAVFLKVNGYHLRVPHPQAFRMLMAITQKKRTIERIAVWLSSFTSNK